MADGSEKPIAEIKVGDKVRATDPATGETTSRTVERLIRTPDDKELVDLTLADGSVIKTTFHHPFWDETADAWTDAADLTSGSVLVGASGGLIDVADVARHFSAGTVMYDLTVEGVHTYYAGDASVLVHNCDGVPFGPQLHYSPKNHAVKAQGRKNPAPTNGLDTLSRSLNLPGNGRIGVDAAADEIVVFYPGEAPGVLHGHVRSWGELDNTQKALLRKQGLVKNNGKIR